MKLLLGCDPEAFLKDVQGTLRSSIGKIGGSKVCPMPLPLGTGYCVQEDNVALEFNIPPAEGRSQFVDSITKTLNFLSEEVKMMYGYHITTESAASFPAEELLDPNALVFGCDPDYNAWTGQINPKPKAADPNLRSCGGHVHVGCGKAVDGRKVIQMMDLHLGVPSVLMDKGDLRKQLYGAAGAYREKSYGVEYRTLSNFWIFDGKTIGWVWDNTSRAVDAVEHLAISNDDSVKIVSAINNNDKALAAQLVDQFGLEVV